MTQNTKPRKLFYTIYLDFKDAEDCLNLIHALLIESYSNIVFIHKSTILNITDIYTPVCKILCVLDNDELYYKDNYSYFNEFRTSFNGCITQFNSLGDGLNTDCKYIKQYYEELEKKQCNDDKKYD